MEPRVIRHEDDYHVALQEAERLVALDPSTGSSDAERLELLTLLIEDYERKQFPFDAPDPVDAILFRMEEQGLKQRDLVPLVGSRSRVSEVLGGKRPLTVSMIRALSTGLGIPLEALVKEPGSRPTRLPAEESDLEWDKFPFKEMQKRGWFEPVKAKSTSTAELLSAFLSQAVGVGTRLALYRRRFRGEELDEKAYYSTLAWSARVLIRAKESKAARHPYNPDAMTLEFLRHVARFSWLSEGPRIAIEFLAKAGIAVIIEPKLPNTLLDGASLLAEQGTPVVGLTLRFDRLDYFWFTLLHELVHVWKHLNSSDEAYVDRIEAISSSDRVEKEANRIARDSFVPRSVWKRSDAFLNPSRESIQGLADELHVHPALVVGRLHFETGKFEQFREFLGQGTVRKLFPELTKA